MGSVIGLAEFVTNRVLRKSSPAVAPSIHGEAQFTGRDRADLDEWASRERRVVMQNCEMGVFAMLHQAGVPWASWGVVRQDRTVLLWNCVTLADIGQFPSMTEALAAIPIHDRPVSAPNVLRFAAAPPLRAAAG